MVGALTSDLGATRPCSAGAAVSRAWDQDAARPLRRGAVRQAPRRDLRLPDPDAPRPRARRRPDPGRVRQGLPQLRHASRSPRTPGPGSTRSPTASRSTTSAARRSSGSCRGPASPAAPSPSAEHLVMDAHLSGDLQRALETIPERQRAALLLAELHDLTGLELAAALGVSHVAARALLTRARESLRQALAVERARRGRAAAITGRVRGRAMSLLGGRGGRPDDWSTQHVRARARAVGAARRPARCRRGRAGSTSTSPPAPTAPQRPPNTRPSASSSAPSATGRRRRRATCGPGPPRRSSARPRHRALQSGGGSAPIRPCSLCPARRCGGRRRRRRDADLLPASRQRRRPRPPHRARSPRRRDAASRRRPDAARGRPPGSRPT